jgi:hypothetical protein
MTHHNKLNFIIFEKPKNKHMKARFWISWINGEWYNYSLPGYVSVYFYPWIMILLLPYLVVQKKIKRVIRDYVLIINPIIKLFGFFRILDMSDRILTVRI